MFVGYKVTRPSNGAVLDCPTWQAHSQQGTLSPMGRQNGDWIRRVTPQFAKEKWIYGPPPVEFGRAALPGPAYKSPGYA